MSLGLAWYLEQVRAEYEMFVAGTLTRPLVADPLGDGVFVLCGEMQAGLRGHAAACFVGADGAVTPLGVGVMEQVAEAVTPVTRRWHEGRRPPTPQVRFGGRCHSFRRALGRYLLGVAEVGERVLVLGAIGESVGVIALERGTAEVLFVGEPGTIGVIDADRLLESWREGHAPGRGGERRSGVKVVSAAGAAGGVGMRSGRGARRGASLAIQSEHRRVCGLSVEVDDGPRISEVLARIFAGVVARAEANPGALAPEQARSWRCCRGRRWIGSVCDALRRCALLGLGDLVGVVGDVHAAIKEALPDFAAPVEALGLVLRRLWVLGCGLVEKTAKGKIWTIRVGAVADPRSQVHRQMCRETATRVVVDGAAEAGRVRARAVKGPVKKAGGGDVEGALGRRGVGDSEAARGENERGTAGEVRSGAGLESEGGESLQREAGVVNGGEGGRREEVVVDGVDGGEDKKREEVRDEERRDVVGDVVVDGGEGGRVEARESVVDSGEGERRDVVGDGVVGGGEGGRKALDGFFAGAGLRWGRSGGEGEAGMRAGVGVGVGGGSNRGSVARGQPGVVRRLAELVPVMPEASPLLVVTVLILSMIAWWEQVDPEVHRRALLLARSWLAAVVAAVEGAAS